MRITIAGRAAFLVALIVLLASPPEQVVGSPSVCSCISTNAASTGSVSVTIIGDSFLDASVASQTAAVGSTVCEGSTWSSTSSLTCRHPRARAMMLLREGEVVVTASPASPSLATTALLFTFNSLTDLFSERTNLVATGSSPVTILASEMRQHNSYSSRIGRSTNWATVWTSDTAMRVLPAPKTARYGESMFVLSAAVGHVPSGQPFASTLNAVHSYDGPSLEGVQLQRPPLASLEFLCPVIGAADWMVALDYRTPLTNITSQTEASTTGSVMVRVLASALGFANRRTLLGSIGHSLVETTKWKSESSLLCRAQRGVGRARYIVVTALDTVSSSPTTLMGAWSFKTPHISSVSMQNTPISGGVSVTMLGLWMSTNDASPKGTLSGTSTVASVWGSDTSAICKTSSGGGQGLPSMSWVGGNNLQKGMVVVSVSPRMAKPEYWSPCTRVFSYNVGYVSGVTSTNVASTAGQSVTVVGNSVGGTVEHTAAIRVRKSGAESTLWQSSTTILVKESAGYRNCAMVLTVGGVGVGIMPTNIASTQSRDQGISYDTVNLVCGAPSNAAVTGAQMVTLVQSRVLAEASMRLRLHDTGVAFTVWKSSSSLTARTLSSSMRNSCNPCVQASVLSETLYISRLASTTRLFSFDSFASSGTPQTVTSPSTGATAAEIIVQNHGHSQILSSTMRFGATATLATAWVSDSSLSVKTGHGSHGCPNVVVSLMLSQTGATGTLLGASVVVSSLIVTIVKSSNLIETGASSVTVIGSNMVPFANSMRLNIGASSLPSTQWLTDTSVQCHGPTRGASVVCVVATIDSATTHLSLVTFGTALESSDNIALSGSISVTVTGVGFGSTDSTSHNRHGGSSAASSRWSSDTTLSTRPIRSAPVFGKPPFAAVTIAERSFSAHSAHTLDAMLVLGHSRANTVSTASVSVTLVSIVSPLQATLIARSGPTTSMSTDWISDTSVSTKRSSVIKSAAVISVSVAAVAGTQQGFTVDGGVVIWSNAPSTGSGFVTVIGSNLRQNDLSTQLRMGKTAIGATEWISSSAILSRSTSSSARSHLPIGVTVETRLVTSMHRLTLDTAAHSALMAANVPTTAGARVTLVGNGWLGAARSATVRGSRTAAWMTQWASATSIIAKSMLTGVVWSNVIVSIDCPRALSSSSSGLLTLDRLIGTMMASNAFPTGAYSVSVIGSGVMSVRTSATVRATASTVESTHWTSDSILTTRSGSMRTIRPDHTLAITVQTRSETLTSQVQQTPPLGLQVEPCGGIGVSYVKTTSGSVSVTVVGAGFGDHVSAAVTLFGSSPEATVWTSQTNVRSKLSSNGGGAAMETSMAVTVSGRAHVLDSTCQHVVFGDLSSVVRTNAPITGALLTTVLGVGYGIARSSSSARFSFTVSDETSWKSDSSLTCLKPARALSDKALSHVMITATRKLRLTTAFALSLDVVFWRQPQSSTPTNAPSSGAASVTVIGIELLVYDTLSSAISSTAPEAVSWVSLSSLTIKWVSTPSEVQNIQLSTWHYVATLSSVFTADTPLPSSATATNTPITGSTTITVLGLGFGTLAKSHSARIGISTCEVSNWVSETAVFVKTPTFLSTQFSSLLMSLNERQDESALLAHVGASYDMYTLAKVCTAVRSNIPCTGTISITLLGEYYSRAIDDAGESKFRVARTQAEDKVWTSASSMSCRVGLGMATSIEIFVSTQRFVTTSVAAFTFNNHMLTMLVNPVNGGATGATSVTLLASQFNMFEPSPVVSIGWSLAEASEWIASTSMRAKATASHDTDIISLFTSTVGTERSTLGTVFSFDEIWIDMHPSIAPSVGGSVVTVIGHQFESTATYNCIFTVGSDSMTVTATNVTITAISCITPNWGALYAARVGTVGLLRGTIPVLGTFGDVLPWQFTEVYQATVVPTQAVVEGGTILAVTGNGFDSAGTADYRCVFQATDGFGDFNHLTAVVSVDSPTRLTCTSPGVDRPAHANVTLTRSGVSIPSIDTSGAKLPAAAFRIFERLDEIFPISGTAIGGTVIAFRGIAMRLSGYTCQFRGAVNMTTAATISNSSVGHCPSPAWGLTRPGGTYSFALYHADDINVYQYGSVFQGAPITFTFIPKWASVVPSLVSAAGGALVTIAGYGFSPSDVYTVQMTGVSGSQPCTFVSPTLLRFVSPNVGAVRAAGSAPISLIVGGSTIVKSGTESAAGFPYEFYEEVLSVAPLSAWAQQSTAQFVTITGTGFSVVDSYACRYVDSRYNVSTTVTISTHSYVVCPVPQWGLYAAESSTALTLHHDGQLLPVQQNATTFVFHSLWWSMSPSSSDIAGGAPLLFVAAGLDVTQYYYCTLKLNSSSASSTAVRPTSSKEVSFLAPPWPFDLQPENATTARPVLTLWNSNTSTEIPVHNNVPYQFLIVKGFAEPTSGSVTGGTSVVFFGANFDPCLRGYFCRFHRGDGSAMDSDKSSPSSSAQVRCDSPSWDASYEAGPTFLQVYLENGPTLTALPNMLFRFEFIEAVTYEQTTPTFVAASGGSTVTIRGSGFRSDSTLYECQFFSRRLNHKAVGSISVLDQRQMLCVAPHWITFGVQVVLTVHMTESGVPLGDGISTFEMRESVLSVWPTRVAASGGSIVNVTAAGLGNLESTSAYICVFSNDALQQSSASATTLDPSYILCEPPVWGAHYRADTVVRFSLLRIAPTAAPVFQANTLLFAFAPDWTSVSASVFRAVGWDFITVSGYGFDNRTVGAAPYICKFDTLDNVTSPDNVSTVPVYSAATVGQVLKATSLRCPVAQWDHPATTVRFSLWQESLPVPGPVVTGTYVEIIVNVSSSAGGAYGGLELTFATRGLQLASAIYRCVFTGVDGNVLSSSLEATSRPDQLKCVTPAWGLEFPAQVTTVSVTKSGVEVAPAESPFAFEFVSGIGYVNTTIGPATGGTIIETTGTGFNASVPFYCLFTGSNGATKTVVVLPISSTRLVLRAPAWGDSFPAQTTTIGFSQNGVLLSGPAIVFKFEPMLIRLGYVDVPARLDQPLPIYGSGFDTASCALSMSTHVDSKDPSRASISLPTTHVSSTELYAMLPGTFGPWLVNVALVCSGESMTLDATAPSQPLRFFFIGVPLVHEIVPSNSPMNQALSVTIIGEYFGGLGSAISVTVGATACASPTYLAPTTMIICTLGPHTGQELDIVVTAPAGSSALNDTTAKFTYLVPRPTVLSAQFAVPGIVSILFDYSILIPLGMERNCSVWFDYESQIALGESSGAECRWPNKRRLEVALGMDSTLRNRGNISMARGLVRREEFQSFTMDAPITVVLPDDDSLVPTIIVAGPTFAGLCDPISLDADPTEGGLGRPLEFVWEYLSPRNHILSPAPLVRDSYLFFADNSINAGIHTWRLNATNYLGVRQSMLIHLDVTSDETRPLVAIKGPQVVKMTKQANVRFTSLAELASCLHIGSGVLIYRWTLRNETSEMYVLEGINANMMKLPPDILSFGNKQTLHLSVHIESPELLLLNTAKGVASVVFDVRPAPIFACIDYGNRTVSSREDLELTSTCTYDPDGDIFTGPTFFIWNCIDRLGRPPCAQLGQWPKLSSSGVSITSLLLIKMTSLAGSNSVIFTVTASKMSNGDGHEGVRSSTTSVEIFIAEPSVIVATSWISTRLERKTNAAQFTTIEALSRSPKPWTCTWDIVQLGETHRIETSAVASRPDACTLVLLPGGLQRYEGSALVFQVSVNTVDGIGGATVATTINAIPQGGSCSLRPTLGEELSTDFFLMCFSWEDADLPLAYGVEVCSEPIAQCGTSTNLLRAFGGRLDYSPLRRLLLPATTDGQTQVTALISDALGAIRRFPILTQVTFLPILQENELESLRRQAEVLLLKYGTGIGVNFIHVIDLLLAKLQTVEARGRLGVSDMAAVGGYLATHNRKLLSSTLQASERTFRGVLLESLISYTRPEVELRRFDGLQEIVDVLATATHASLLPNHQAMANSFLRELIDELVIRSSFYSTRLPAKLLTRVMQVIGNEIRAALSLVDASVSSKSILSDLNELAYKTSLLTLSGVTQDEMVVSIVNEVGVVAQRVSGGFASLQALNASFEINITATDSIVMVQNYVPVIFSGQKKVTTNIYNISAVNNSVYRGGTLQNPMSAAVASQSLIQRFSLTMPLNADTKPGSPVQCIQWNETVANWEHTCSSTRVDWEAWQVTCVCNGTNIVAADIVYICTPMPQACTGHGVCSNGRCLCDSGWTGLDCEKPCLPCMHGQCLFDTTCRCDEGWFGDDCSSAPEVISVEPTIVPTIGGINVTVSGRVFGTRYASHHVTIGESVCESPAWLSESSLQCVVARGTGKDLLIVLTTSGRQSSPNAFAVVSYAGPVVSSIEPTTAPTSGGGVMTVFGHNFGLDVNSGISVMMNNKRASTLFVSDSSAKCQMVSGLGAKIPIIADVRHQLSPTNTDFSYLPPVVTSVSPSASPDYRSSLVTVSGQNLAAIGYESLVEIWMGATPCIPVQIANNSIICRTGMDDGLRNVTVMAAMQRSANHSNATFFFTGMIGGLHVDEKNTSMDTTDDALGDGAFILQLGLYTASLDGTPVVASPDLDTNPIAKLSFEPQGSVFGVTDMRMSNSGVLFSQVRFDGFPGAQYVATVTLRILNPAYSIDRTLSAELRVMAPECRPAFTSPYLPDLGAPICLCDVGFGMPRSTDADRACQPCDGVSFQPKIMSQTCFLCPDLDYMETYPLEEFENYWQFAVDAGLSQGKRAESGARVLDDCKCKAGTWRNTTMRELLGDNNFPGVLIQPAEGDEVIEWWADESVPLCKPCPLKGSCLGDYAGIGDKSCAPGYTGALCAVCEQGLIMDKVLGKCQPCPPVSQYVIAIASVVVVVVILGIFGAKIRFLLAKLVPVSDMKLVTSYIVVVVQMKDVYELKMPPVFTEFLFRIDFMSKLDFGEFSYCTTGVRLGFYSSLTTKILLPFGFVVVAAASHALPPLFAGAKVIILRLINAPEDEYFDPIYEQQRQKLDKQIERKRKEAIGKRKSMMSPTRPLDIRSNTVDAARSQFQKMTDKWMKKFTQGKAFAEKTAFVDMVTSIVLIVLTALHSFVTSTIFQLFQCESIVGYELKFLRADFTLRCQDGTWFMYMTLGMGVVAVFTFGYPLGMFILLYKRRKEFYRSRDAVFELYKSTVLAERSELLGMLSREMKKVQSPEEVRAHARKRMDMQKGMNAAYSEAARRHIAGRQSWMAVRSLHMDYKPQYVYWEVLEIMRKFLMTSFIVFVVEYAQGFDLIVGTSIALVFTMAQVNFKPYRARRANMLQFIFLGTQLGMLFLLLLLTLSKHSEDYNLSFIGGSMVAFNIAVLVMALSFNAFRAVWRLGKQGYFKAKDGRKPGALGADEKPTLDKPGDKEAQTERYALETVAVKVQYKYRWLVKHGISLSSVWKAEQQELERQQREAESARQAEMEFRMNERRERAERNRRLQEDAKAQEMLTVKRMEEPDDLVQLRVDEDSVDADQDLDLDGVYGHQNDDWRVDIEFSTPTVRPSSSSIQSAGGLRHGRKEDYRQSRDTMQDGMEFDYSDDENVINGNADGAGLGNMEFDATDDNSQFSLIIDDADQAMADEIGAGDGRGVTTVLEEDGHNDDW